MCTYDDVVHLHFKFKYTNEQIKYLICIYIQVFHKSRMQLKIPSEIIILIISDKNHTF